MHNILAFLFVSNDKNSLISLQCMCLLTLGHTREGGLRWVVAHP